MSSCVKLIDELKDNVDNFDCDGPLKKGLKTVEKHDINSFDTRGASKQHRIPDSLKSTILTSSVGRNKTATAEDMLALLRQIVGQILGEICWRFGRNNSEIMRTAELAFLQRTSL